MGIQLVRPQSPSGNACPFLGRSPFLGQGYSRNPLAVVHTTVAPKAKRVEAAQYLQTSKDLDTDTVAVDSALALERVVVSLLIRSLLQPIVCWAFQGTIGSKAIGWGLSPYRPRTCDRIRARSLCSPFETPSLCAIAQNISIPCRKPISASNART